MIDPSGKNIYLNETNISNDYDRKFMFIKGVDSPNTQWIDVTNEHFIVWMQMESFSNFRKLWARIDTAINPGTYKINIKSSKI
jgi:hypothetical protein